MREKNGESGQKIYEIWSYGWSLGSTVTVRSVGTGMDWINYRAGARANPVAYEKMVFMESRMKICTKKVGIRKWIFSFNAREIWAFGTKRYVTLSKRCYKYQNFFFFE